MAASRKKKTEGPARPRRRTISVPGKGGKCVRTERPVDGFHKGSFRWVQTPDMGKGTAFVHVGCPLTARSVAEARRKGSKHRTKWNPKAPLGMQCTYADTGRKAGMLAHEVVQPLRPSGCRTGYRRA